jgi:hypothetical protein
MAKIFLQIAFTPWVRPVWRPIEPRGFQSQCPHPIVGTVQALTRRDPRCPGHGIEPRGAERFEGNPCEGKTSRPCQVQPIVTGNQDMESIAWQVIATLPVTGMGRCGVYSRKVPCPRLPAIRLRPMPWRPLCPQVHPAREIRFKRIGSVAELLSQGPWPSPKSDMVKNGFTSDNLASVRGKIAHRSGNARPPPTRRPFARSTQSRCPGLADAPVPDLRYCRHPEPCWIPSPAEPG